MKSKKQSKNRDILFKEFSFEVLRYLSLKSSPTHWRDIISGMGLRSSAQTNDLIRVLKYLTKNGKTQEVEGRYSLLQPASSFVGVLDVNSSGNGYVLTSEMESDIFVAQKYLNHGFGGDTVRVVLLPDSTHDKPKGEITEIIERKKTSFVGILQIRGGHCFVLPTDRDMYVDFYINKNRLMGAKDGDKVLVKMLEWKKSEKSPIGVIDKVLGLAGEHETEMNSILLENDLPISFPPEVEDYAKALDTSITQEEISSRRDMRNVLTFTIDPWDANDFDDALSFEKLENGNYSVGVHIADVSFYVKEGSVLDKEAYLRGNSVYLVDRVVPMLPEVLSNFACSLRPGEDKYTFSAVFEITPSSKVVGSWFGKTVINSNERFSYSEAQEIIEHFHESSTYTSYAISKENSIRGGSYSVGSDVVESISVLDSLARIMKEQRMRNGAISFESTEVKFRLDENKNPVDVYVKESKEANFLIEEFMLLANCKVAEFIHSKGKTFIYRVHDAPDEQKLTQMNNVISHLGYCINLKSNKTISRSLNSILSDVKGRKEQNLVDTLAVRSMSKAKYSTCDIGHYGLAFEHYCHFTSPIRRYPDIMAHRLLQRYLNGGDSASADFYESCCKHCSSTESLATNAERDSVKYMQVKYMQSHSSGEFLGVISGVSEWGIYVEIIENKCEGMIRLRDLPGDYFSFEQKSYSVVGQNTGVTYQIGDEVKVRVKGTDLIRRLLDFEFISKN